jgi:hypothetical protein
MDNQAYLFIYPGQRQGRERERCGGNSRDRRERSSEADGFNLESFDGGGWLQWWGAEPISMATILLW